MEENTGKMCPCSSVTKRTLGEKNEHRTQFKFYKTMYKICIISMYNA